MEFVYEPMLQNYMKQKGKKNIIIEVISSNCSDFEVTELYVHFVNEKQTDYFKSKKNFRSVVTLIGEVLLPPYRLEYDEVITFGLKSFLGIKMLTQKGVRL